MAQAREWAAKLAQAQPGVHLRTLIGIRWVAVAGQFLTMAVSAGVFNMPVPWLPALITIGALAAFNLIVTAALAPGRFLSGRQAAMHLAFDVVQLSTLVLLTGGLLNPFVVLVLVPLTTSATILSYRSTLALLVLAVLCLTVMMFWSWPLPWPAGALDVPPLYRGGVFSALVLCMLLLAIYAWRLSNEARRRQQALVATQAALAREQKLSELGALAAAAAHELGGPLGTILLIANELDRQIGDDPEFGEDIRLLKAEAGRGRSILTELSARAHADAPFPWVGIEILLREVGARGGAAGAVLHYKVAPGAAGLLIERTPEVLHALGNLIDNALRHASRQVMLHADRIGDLVRIRIEDDGPGFPDHLLPRLGEPYLAQQDPAADVAATDAGAADAGPIGLGLGIFIAVTLLERTGALCSFTNGKERGACIDISWPISRFRHKSPGT